MSSPRDIIEQRLQRLQRRTDTEPTDEEKVEEIQKTGPPEPDEETEKTGTALDARRKRELESQIQRIERLREKAQEMEFLPLSPGPPPEDYYYEAEDVRQYRSEAREYNKLLREYKREVGKLWVKARRQRISVNEYERLSRDYVQKLRERQGQITFAQYMSTYGPPEPSESVLTRRRAGLPDEGLPGPGAGPAPGSLGARLQESTGRTLTAMETPFRAVTDPLRDTATILDELSRAELQTTQPYEPRRQLGAQTTPMPVTDTQLREPREPSPGAGAAAYFASVVADVGASTVDVATLQIRPGLWAEAAGGLVGLGVEAVTPFDYGYTRGLREAALGDPFRFTSQIIGASVLGPELQAIVPKAVSGVRQVYAARRWASLGVDESVMFPFEQELGLQYPEPTGGVDVTRRLFERRTLGVEGLDDIPYYVQAAEPGVREMVQRVLDESVDDWSPDAVSTAEPTALPYEYRGVGGFVKADGSFAPMKPFKPPKEAVAPRSEAITVGASKARSSVIIPSSQVEFTGVVDVTTFAPAVDLQAGLLSAPTVLLPKVSPDIVSGLGLGVGLSAAQRRSIRVQEQEMMKQVLKAGPPSPPMLGIQPITAQLQRPMPSQVQRIDPIQAQRPRDIQIIMPKITQIQDQPQPEPTPPPIPVIKTPPPPKPSKIKIPRTPSDKRRRRPRQIRGTGFEFRVDPLKITIPDMKKIKVPKI